MLFKSLKLNSLNLKLFNSLTKSIEDELILPSMFNLTIVPICSIGKQTNSYILAIIVLIIVTNTYYIRPCETSICDALRDLEPFVQFKKRAKHP